MVAGDLSVFSESIEKIEDISLTVSQLLTGINVTSTEVSVNVIPRNTKNSTVTYDVVVSVLEIA